jgi:hypothetical protein
MSVVGYVLSKTAPRPILLIETTGDLNATPGVIGTAAYFVTGVTALFTAGNLFEGTRSGLTFDMIRTTREVATSLSEFSFRTRCSFSRESPSSQAPLQLAVRCEAI